MLHCMCKMVEEIGEQYIDFIPIMVLVPLTLLQALTPIFSWWAIISGSNIFYITLKQVALQTHSASCGPCL